MRLTGIFLYPVKSLAGVSVSSVSVDELGLVGDRRFLVVDEAGRFLTQRTLPRMALIAAALDPTHLTLSHSATDALRVPRAADPSALLRNVSVWKSENLLAEDCGDAPAHFLSDFLSIRCRLVRPGSAFIRPVLKPAARPGDIVSFADAVPLLIICESTLADLNDRLIAGGSDSLPMNRFRPNLVISGAPAFAEDTWPRLRIGQITFRAGGPCARCTVTTTDQATGRREGPEPLRTLATYRRSSTDPTNVNFGQNLIHETKSGSFRVGDAVEVLP